MQCYKIRPCTNNSPQKTVGKSGEQEYPERSFSAVETII